MSDKLQQAITLIKSGDKQNGRRLLAEVLKADPGNETAWLWMSSVVVNDERRLYCLEQVLKINPHHQLAKTGLARLQRNQKTQAMPIESPQQPTSFTTGVSESKDEPAREPQTATSVGQLPDAEHQPTPAPSPLSMKRPSSIKAICYFYWFNTAILGAIGLVSVLLVIGPLLTGAVTPSKVAVSTSEILFAGGILGLSVILVVLAIVFAIVGWGLWRLKNWARYSAIAISSVMVALGLISYFFASLSGESRLSLSLALHGLVLVTLLRQHARSIFAPAQIETESSLAKSKPGLANAARPAVEHQPTQASVLSPAPGKTEERYSKCSYCLSKNPEDVTTCWHCGRDFAPLRKPKDQLWITMWIRALTQPRVRTFEDFVLNRKDAGVRAYIWIFFASLISGIILEFLGDADKGTLVVVSVSMVSFALTTGIVFLFARSLGGTGSYTQHALAVAAYAAPLSLLMSLVSLIPFGDLLNLFLIGYGIILYVIAIKAVHQLEWAKAIYPLSPFILLACLATVFLLVIGPEIAKVYSDIATEVAGLPEGCPPDCVGVDLSGTDLHMVDLRGADLRGANLRGARIDETTQIDDKWQLVWEIVNHSAEGRDLTGTDLGDANLNGSILIGSNLIGADLRGADLRAARLHGAKIDETTQIDDKWQLVWEIVNQGGEGRDLAGTDLSGANLTGANLRGADLLGANLREANLSRAILHKAKMDGTTQIDAKWRLVWEIVNQGAAGQNLSGVDLSEADLTGINLTDTDLCGANLTGAELRGVSLHQTKMDDTTQIDGKWRLVWEIVNQGAQRQDLAGVDLSGANLAGVDLSGSSLGKTDLREADLRGADLRSADLSMADLHKARFDNTTQIDTKWRLVWEIVNQDVEGRGLTGADLSRANLKNVHLGRANLIESSLEGSDLEGADLHGADLSGANLGRANLTGANLTGANLSEANLRWADLLGADLRGVNLSKATLHGTTVNDHTQLDAKWRLVWEIVNQGAQGQDLAGVDLSWANLAGGDFRESDLDGADLREADLEGANLRRANLTGARLTGADLTGANLSGAVLYEARIDDSTRIDDKWRLIWEIVHQGARGRDLAGADLCGANLTGVDLAGVNLRGASLGGADLSGVNLSAADLTLAYLVGANLSEANLGGAALYGAKMNESTQIDAKWRLVWEIVNQGAQGRDLTEADLSGANLGNANLLGANLSRSNLSEADLSKANLEVTDLRGADLSGAVMDEAKLGGAYYDDSTSWPSGFILPSGVVKW